MLYDFNRHSSRINTLLMRKGCVNYLKEVTSKVSTR